MNISVPIEIITLEDKSYHIMVEAKLNNNEVINLIIDTGASKTVFDREYLTPFSTEISEVEDNKSSGINAMITKAHIGTIEQFSIGNLIQKDFACLMLDLSHINELYKNYSDKFIAGLLGSDFLVEHNAIINYQEKTLCFQL